MLQLKLFTTWNNIKNIRKTLALIKNANQKMYWAHVSQLTDIIGITSAAEIMFYIREYAR